MTAQYSTGDSAQSVLSEVGMISSLSSLVLVSAVFIHLVIWQSNFPWWRHRMEIFSALLALCAGNSSVPVISPLKGQWRGALMFSLIYSWINDWVNNREAGDLRRHCGHYDVNVMHFLLNVQSLETWLDDPAIDLKFDIRHPQRQHYCRGGRQNVKVIQSFNT